MEPGPGAPPDDRPGSGTADTAHRPPLYRKPAQTGHRTAVGGAARPVVFAAYPGWMVVPGGAVAGKVACTVALLLEVVDSSGETAGLQNTPPGPPGGSG
ncbi:hypothetical protein GCM10023329_36470 [Streptomyces sanyensis]|uniref:Uncharacterized protein n=1 Tax=Streptomyces sanyensis TaxID=568869 RepID=A0ABP9ALM0_9ACTN